VPDFINLLNIAYHLLSQLSNWGKKDELQLLILIYTMSAKTHHLIFVHVYVNQIETNIHTSFTGTFSGKFAVMVLLIFPPRLSCIAVVACEI